MLAPPDGADGGAAGDTTTATAATAGAAGASTAGDAAGDKPSGSLSTGKEGQTGGSEGAAAPYRPEGLPDHLFGGNDKETIDKLFEQNKGFRERTAAQGAVPKTADDYKLEVTDESIKPYVADFEKDAAFKTVRTAAHAAGITDAQFNKLVPTVLKGWVDGGLGGQPFDAEAALMSLAPAEMANADVKAQRAAAAKRVTSNVAWVDNAKVQGTLPPAVADYINARLGDDPEAHAMVEWLQGKGRQVKPAMGGGKAAGGVTAESLQARMNDPKGDPRSSSYDKNFAAETDRLSKEFYG